MYINKQKLKEVVKFKKWKSIFTRTQKEHTNYVLFQNSVQCNFETL